MTAPIGWGRAARFGRVPTTQERDMRTAKEQFEEGLSAIEEGIK